MLWTLVNPRRWGLLLVAAGLLQLRTAQGDTQHVELGALFIVIGAAWFAIGATDLFNLGFRRRRKGWENTIDQGAEEVRSGNSAAAEQTFQKAVSRAAPGPQRQRANQKVAATFIDQRRPIEAIPFFENAVRSKELMSKRDDRSLGELRLKLAELYLGCGYVPHAAGVLQRQVESGVLVREAKVLLAESCVLDGRPADGQSILDALIAQLTAERGQWDVSLSEPLLELAGIQLQGDDVAGAEQTLLHAYDCANRTGEVDLCQRARAGIVAVYDREGRAEDAAEMLSKYMAVASGVQAVTTLSTVETLRDYGRLLVASGNETEGARMTKRAELIAAAAERDKTIPGEREAIAHHRYRDWWRRSMPVAPVVPAQ